MLEGKLPDNSKYLIISTLYLPHIGGVEMYSKNLAYKLIERGNEAVLVTSNLYNTPSIQIKDGLKIYSLPCYKLLGGRFPVARLNKEHRSLFKKIEQEGIDYVIVNMRIYLLSLLGLRFARRHKLPAIVLEHGVGHFTIGHRFWDFAGHIYEHFITLLDTHIEQFQ